MTTPTLRPSTASDVVPFEKLANIIVLFSNVWTTPTSLAAQIAEVSE